MRWFRIRKATIEPELRATLELYGVGSMQAILGRHTTFWQQDRWHGAHDPPYLKYVIDWLCEQYDRAERRETWTLTMEAAITVFVILEVALVVAQWPTSRTICR